MPKGPIVRAAMLAGFLAVVSLGVLGLLAVPSVGKALGPLACEAGETMIAHTSNYSGYGRSGTSVTYACLGPAGERTLGFFDLVKPALLIHFGFFAIVVFPLCLMLFARTARRAPTVHGFEPAGGFDMSTIEDLTEMALKLAKSHPSGTYTTTQRQFTIVSDGKDIEQAPEDPVEALRALTRMRDEGLITSAEYEAKKAEILASL